MMLPITQEYRSAPSIVTIGIHKGIIQSILDFDFLCGNEPSILAIIGGNKKYERFFFGTREVVIPVRATAEALPLAIRESANKLINLSSGRRVLYSTILSLEHLPAIRTVAVFAEEVPEQHALNLRKECERRNIVALGGATVGLLLPGHLKLGAIGGVDYRQIEQAHLNSRGSIAVMSSSGGMTNELINIVAQSGFGVSFAVSFGGERFPLMAPIEAFLSAEKDPGTYAIAYFGELGGDDEYDIVTARRDGRLTKPVVAYIAGKVAELFDQPPQFGHAKAMAQSNEESASAKQAALRETGIIVPDSFGDFVTAVNRLEGIPLQAIVPANHIGDRHEALFVSSIAHIDHDGELRLVGKTLPEIASCNYGDVVSSLFLGHQPASEHTGRLVELILKLLVDHGPHVSGAVNTMISASANRDLVSSLTTGLLTIGSRFGGAVNGAAATLLYATEKNMTPSQLVEEIAAKKQLIPGIGHKKYNIGFPDPRVELLINSLPDNIEAKYLKYAKEIEAITTKKGSSLILNVDGAIAACLLDSLHELEGYDSRRLRELVDVEFFNAFFVAARSVGFIAHYLDQRRLDQGLFRLGGKDISFIAA